MNSLSSKSKPISSFLFSRPSSPPSRIFFVSLFSNSSSSYSNSPSSFQNQPPSLSRRHDEESKNVRVSVWWDIENCSVPNGVNVFKISHFITSAVRANGIKGPVHVTAFGDIQCLTRANQEALSSTGVNLVHIPHGGKNSADRSLLVDLMYWVSQNPPPAHVFLISGDRDFAGILHKLRMNNYNILLAAGTEFKHTPGVLCSAASIMWQWNELAKGKSLTGRHFNQPPDGPFNSWYGHYKGYLEDPFDVSEQKSCSEADNSSDAESTSESKHRPGPVPVAILRQIRRIVNAYPYGLSITQLHNELAKNKVLINKNFYGHKNFSSFLRSMPHIIEIEDRPDGQFFIRPASPRVRKPVEDNDTSTRSVIEKKNQDVKVDEKANVQNNSITRMAGVGPQSPVSPYVDCRERTVEEKATKVFLEKKTVDAPQRDKEVAAAKELPVKEASNAEVAEIPVALKEEKNSESDIALFKRLWSMLFGAGIDAEKTRNNIPVKLRTSSGCKEVSTSKEQEAILINQHGLQHPGSSSTALNDDAKSITSDESEDSPGFFRSIKSWFKSWRNSSVRTSTAQCSEDPGFTEEKSREPDDASLSRKHELFTKDALTERSSEEPGFTEENSRESGDASRKHKLFSKDGSTEQSSEKPGFIEENSRESDVASLSMKHDLFSKNTFWNALRAFFRTRRGIVIVTNSTSRKQFAEKLQKEGPLALRALQDIDLCHLVDLLVSEKKWIEELPTKTPRFKIIYFSVESSAEDQPQTVQPHSSTGLSSIFMSSASLENPQMTVSSSYYKKPSEKSRLDVLADCQKLLNELLLKYPEGFNIGCFKKHFLEKYGYFLDHQKIGYPKLLSVLQIMPGVKVYASYIYPESVIYAPGIKSLGLTEKSSGSAGEVSDSPQKNEDSESPWEELGPVSKQGMESTSGQVNSIYEPPVSDDDEFSELEEDATSFAGKAEDQNRSRMTEEGNPLMDVLATFEGPNDESDPLELDSHAEGLVDCCKEESEPTKTSNSCVNDEAASAFNHAWKQRPQRSYMFVSNPIEAKDQLIDGILGNVKKWKQ